ncbi:MAG: hypothetical protein HY601_00490 [Candidatus Omnitrophica bacterium]|nr:hypothetical protein [Candidatus Omnitrophota bacterium]
MPEKESLDSETLWQRLGLARLREALTEVHQFSEAFERALRGLPSCSACAKSALLERIRLTGRRLGTEAVSLSALAENLKESAALAEAVEARLAADAPAPCRCPTTVCTCHG